MMGKWVVNSQAWLDLKPPPRALYLAIKERYNGNNNGEIFLTHRDVAKLLNVHRNSSGTYFNVLIEHSFLKQISRPHLGPSGDGLKMGAYRVISTWNSRNQRVHAMAKKIESPHIFCAWASQFMCSTVPAWVKNIIGVTKSRTHWLQRLKSAPQQSGHINI